MQAHPQDLHVFLLSNRAAQADRLASAVGLVLPCRLIEPGRPWPGGRPLAFVVDLARGAAGDTSDEAWIEAVALRCRAEAVPCLYVARGASPDPAELRRFGAPTVVSAASRSAGIVASLQGLLDKAREAEAACARLEARVEAASRRVAQMFSAAAAHGSVKVRDAEDGTEIVLAAVSEAGIRSWLDRLRRHHVGVYQHSLSVAGFAAAFAEVLGLNGRDRHRLAQAALVHDVGKARIPVAVLDKPGPLTPEEMAVMQTHAAVGADLLGQAGGFEPAVLDVVRHHHERLDGSGYPDELSGGAIGDLVRLVAICDVHSALTERRAYRPPMPGHRARAVMEGMRGQLDPDLLRAYGPVIARSDGARADGISGGTSGRMGDIPSIERTFS